MNGLHPKTTISARKKFVFYYIINELKLSLGYVVVFGHLTTLRSLQVLVAPSPNPLLIPASPLAIV